MKRILYALLFLTMVGNAWGVHASPGFPNGVYELHIYNADLNGGVPTISVLFLEKTVMFI